MPPVEESGASLEAIRTLESAALSSVGISNNLDAERGSRLDTPRDDAISRTRSSAQGARRQRKIGCSRPIRGQREETWVTH